MIRRAPYRCSDGMCGANDCARCFPATYAEVEREAAGTDACDHDPAGTDSCDHDPDEEED